MLFPSTCLVIIFTLVMVGYQSFYMHQQSSQQNCYQNIRLKISWSVILSMLCSPRCSEWVNSWWHSIISSTGFADMNGENFTLSEKLVSPSYIRQASQARRSHELLIRQLLEQVRPPAAASFASGHRVQARNVQSSRSVCCRANVQRRAGARAPSSSSWTSWLWWTAITSWETAASERGRAAWHPALWLEDITGS